MNPFQTFAVLFCCFLVVAIKTSLLMAQGISLLMALFLVYLAAVVFMLGLQRRARQSCESSQFLAQDVTIQSAPARTSDRTRLTIV